MGILESWAASSTDIFIATALLAFIYIVGLAVSRRYFHPLSGFPGPCLAAITNWYEFYYDVVQDGTFLGRIPMLHKHFGPIVRISPHHLHVDDPEFYREVFCAQTNYWKAPWFYSNLGIDDSLISIIDPHKHRIHRSVVNPLFSTASIGKLSPNIDRIVDQAAKITEERLSRGEPVNIQKLFRCITVDVIYTACFGFSPQLTTQYKHDIVPDLLDTMNAFTGRTHLSKHFPFISRAALALPISWAAKLSPGYAHFRHQLGAEIGKVNNRRQKGIRQTEDGNSTVFDLFMEPNADRGYRAPTMTQLLDEAILFVIAGSESTAFALSWATYGLLTNPDCQKKLKEELREVPRTEQGSFAWRDISDLPYLTAVVKECLRLSSSVPGLFPRVVPPGGVTVQGKFIPAGTSVSISIWIMHNNPELFPSPEEFQPERWLGEAGKDLDKWMLAFSKGPRACIGLNLAYLEIYTVLATFFSRFDMELFETDASSMTFLDHGLAKNKSDVVVKGKLMNTDQAEVS